MILELPENKKQKVLKLKRYFLNQKECTIRELAEFIGYLVSCCPAIKYSWTHTKI